MAQASESGLPVLHFQCRCRVVLKPQANGFSSWSKYRSCSVAHSHGRDEHRAWGSACTEGVTSPLSTGCSASALLDLKACTSSTLTAFAHRHWELQGESLLSAGQPFLHPLRLSLAEVAADFGFQDASASSTVTSSLFPWGVWKQGLA